MFIYSKKIEVNAHDVIDVVRLLGHFGLRFTISAEYCKVDDLNTERKERFREFEIFGTRKQLEEFFTMRRTIVNYHMH